jgi:Peptidase M50B-like
LTAYSYASIFHGWLYLDEGNGNWAIISPGVGTSCGFGLGLTDPPVLPRARNRRRFAGSMFVVTVLSQVWQRLIARQPAPTDAVVLGSAAVAILLVGVPGLWRRSRYLVTITHEAAHGLVAVASGRRLSGIRLHADASGLLLSRGRASGPGMFFTAAAGYVGPALFGLGAAYLLREGHPVALLSTAVVLLVVVLTLVRNWFGLWLVLAAGVGVFAVSWWGNALLQTWFAYAGAWFLLVSAPRPVIELQSARRRRAAPNSDADTLARLSGIPGLIWVGVFLAVAIGALALGGHWLLMAAN